MILTSPLGPADDHDNDPLGPRLLERPGGGPAGGTCGEDVVDEEHGSAVEASARAEGTFEPLLAFGSADPGEDRGPFDPPQGERHPQAQATGKGVGQGLSLVVTALEPSNPVEWDGDDERLAIGTDLGQQSVAAGVGEQLGEPPGEPFILLVLEPKAEVTDRAEIGSEGDRSVESEGATAALIAPAIESRPRANRHRAAGADRTRLAQLGAAVDADRGAGRFGVADRASHRRDEVGERVTGYVEEAGKSAQARVQGALWPVLR